MNAANVLRQRRAAQVVAHVDEHVAVLRQRLQRAAGAGVAGIDERLAVRVEPVAVGREVRREVMHLDDAHASSRCARTTSPGASSWTTGCGRARSPTPPRAR